MQSESFAPIDAACISVLTFSLHKSTEDFISIQKLFKMSITERSSCMQESNKLLTGAIPQISGQQIKSKIESFQKVNFLISQQNPMV